MFSSSGASCSQPMMTLATGWLRLNCSSSTGAARPVPLPTSMPWPMTFIDRMPKFFANATGKADCSKAGIGSILRWAMGLADWAALSDIKTVSKSYRTSASAMAMPSLWPVMPMKRATFCCLRSRTAASTPDGAADALEIVKIGQAVDLNQIDVIGLQELETGFHRAQGAVAIARVDLGGEKNFFTALFGKLTEALFAEPLDTAPGVGAGGVEVIDAEHESAFEQRLRRVFIFDRTEPGARTEADAGYHFAGLAQTAPGQRGGCGAGFFNRSKQDGGGSSLEK